MNILASLWFFFSVSLSASLFAADAPKQCAAPSLASNFNLNVPCIGVNGLQYQTTLNYVGNPQGYPVWAVGQTQLSDCSWSYQNCATLTADGTLKLLNFSLEGKATNATLQREINTKDQGIYFKYLSHRATPSKSGRSDSQGTLVPYSSQRVVDGSQKKLLAIYMVGSDLENSWNQAATLDLKELLQGYKKLVRPNVEVVVAFGGANKDGWRGMTIATVQQLLADAEDGQFGNAQDYLYRAPLAHMGDSSSLQLFLQLLRNEYRNFNDSFFAFWDHGGAYNGFGVDENYNNDLLSLSEIQKALGQSGLHFSLLGFDACLMASAEVANYLQQAADYLLSSEEIEPGHGWNWEKVITLYADQGDIVSRAKNMIDSYSDNAGHAYKSSGKTLSLVDLAQYEQFKTLSNQFFEGLNKNLRQNVTSVIDNATLALNRTRTYTESHHISIDLVDFGMNLLGLANSNIPAEAALVTQINALVDASQRYVVYSRHDGSRPYSYGVSINPPNNKVADANIGEAQTELQTTWQQLVANDSDAPVSGGQQNNVAASQAQLSDTVFTEADLSALQGVIQQLLSSGSISQAQYDLYAQGINVLKKGDLTAEEKFLELEAIENNARGVIPRGVFARGVYARGVAARGVIAKGLIARGISSRKIAPRAYDVSYTNALPFMQGERAHFVYQPAGIIPKGIATGSNVKGTVATFTDSHPLAVKTIYGTVRTDAKTKQQLFETIAELEAYPTANPHEYFTPSWNRVWYNIKFNSQQPSQWLPLTFVKRFRENNQTLTVYSAQLHYVDGNKSYPVPSAAAENRDLCLQKGYIIDNVNNCVEQAMLELIVNDQNQVLQHKVTSFKQLYQGVADEPVIVFDKVSNELKSGDKIRLLFETANLSTGQGNLWGATTRDEFIVFKQKPQFGTELLAFVDKDSGESLDFYYTMRAKDIAGKQITAAPQIAPVDIPNCAKLTTTATDFNAVLNYLQDETQRIQFNSPLGSRFDEANATALTLDAALHDAVFSDKVTRLISLLYNPGNLDKVNSTWVWDSVNFVSVKAALQEVVPTVAQVQARECH